MYIGIKKLFANGFGGNAHNKIDKSHCKNNKHINRIIQVIGE
jgi:hypothetical protein